MFVFFFFFSARLVVPFMVSIGSVSYVLRKSSVVLLSLSVVFSFDMGDHCYYLAFHVHRYRHRHTHTHTNKHTRTLLNNIYIHIFTYLSLVCRLSRECRCCCRPSARLVVLWFERGSETCRHETMIYILITRCCIYSTARHAPETGFLIISSMQSILTSCKSTLCWRREFSSGNILQWTRKREE